MLFKKEDELFKAYGIKWKQSLLIFIAFFITAAILVYLDIFQSKYNGLPNGWVQVLDVSDMKKVPGYFVKTKGCQIPELDPFDERIQRYLENLPLHVCNNDSLSPLVDSNLTSIFILNSSVTAYGIKSVADFKCCYQTFWRVKPGKEEKDKQVKYSHKCVYFKKKAYISREFVRVKCFYNNTEIYTDFFAFAPKKTHALRMHNRPNVLILGMDALSRLNLMRQMPKTVKYLQELGSIDMHGFSKVGDNTFPNLIPVLTGLTETELQELCWPNRRTRFDKCPFIWRDFKRKHYTTAYGEDSGYMGIFAYNKYGFFKQPTDYVWYVFGNIAEKKQDRNGLTCIGPRLTFHTLLEYVDKFTMSMNIYGQPYFGFFWGVSISHDYLNTPKWGDDKVSELFKRLNASGRLDNTVLIFMSDHGIRWGGIHHTLQGKVEERMPFLHILLPKTFLHQTYQTARLNMLRNKYKLTTPFDLHETLVDLISPDVLTTEYLENRILTRKNNNYDKIPRGFSLFDKIPDTRTCEDAHIEPQWCVCQTIRPIDVTDKVVQEASTFIVKYMNDQLLEYEECANLILDKISHAQIKKHSENITVEEIAHYTVMLTTRPGGAIFESTLKQRLVNGRNVFEMTGTVSRLNLHEKQSDCITDIRLKLYCFCGTTETKTPKR